MTAKRDLGELRQIAETRLKAKTEASQGLNAKDLPRLVHELHVHQIELEMQNSELEKTRAELETALSLYTDLYDFAPVGYLTLTAEGDISRINLTGARLLGVERRHLLQRRFAAFVDAGDQDRWARHFQHLKESSSGSATEEAAEQAESTELLLQRENGASFHVQLNCIRPDVGHGGGTSSDRPRPGGEVLPVLQKVHIALIDISARKEIEAERALLDQALQNKNIELERARFVADKANKAKSEFLSAMSHELRTPLGAILGFAQLMESGTPPPTASQLRSISQILKAGWYLLELINEILDLALIESGRLSLTLEPVALADVIRECEAMVESQAQNHSVSLSFAPLKDAFMVSADRTRVKQVLINLLSNAIKYNQKDGAVYVDCIQNGRDTIRISVRDTGAGLDAGQIAQLFQPFNRLGQEGGAEQGTGIGLVVCKRLVELMGGVIGVECLAGEGCTFWIDLKLVAVPRLHVDMPEPAEPARSSLPAEKPVSTLLYVEDNPANLMLVSDLIARRPDIRLVSATDGCQGVELARACLPDVILMDINLPGISGLGALDVLTRDPATVHIPVLAISANAMPRDIEKGLGAGFFRYLTKPIRIDEFMAALDSAFEAARKSRLAQ